MFLYYVIFIMHLNFERADQKMCYATNLFNLSPRGYERTGKREGERYDDRQVPQPVRPKPPSLQAGPERR